MNEDLIKQEFVRENIEKDIRAIFEAQYLIATERVYTSAIYPTQVGQRRSFVQEQGYGRLVRGTTGRLLSALRNPVYSVGFSGRGVVATSNIPLYIRFLDMKKHGDYGMGNPLEQFAPDHKIRIWQGGPRPYLCRITGSFPKNGNTYGFLKTHCPFVRKTARLFLSLKITLWENYNRIISPGRFRSMRTGCRRRC